MGPDVCPGGNTGVRSARPQSTLDHDPIRNSQSPKPSLRACPACRYEMEIDGEEINNSDTNYSQQEILDLLHHSRPQAERCVAVHIVIHRLGLFSAEEIRPILEAVNDMLQPRADAQSQWAGLCLLENVARDKMHPALLPFIVDIATRALDKSVFPIQIMVLETGTEQLDLCVTSAERLVDFLTASLATAFESAEHARQNRGKVQAGGNEKSSSDLLRRPDEEVALIKALSVLQKTICTFQDNMQPNTISSLFHQLTVLLRRTTGQAILGCLLGVLSASAGLLITAPSGLEDCLYLLCSIAHDVTLKNSHAAHQVLSGLLQSPIRLEVLRLLTQIHTAETSQALPVRVFVLQTIAEVFVDKSILNMQPNVLSPCIKALCENIRRIPRWMEAGASLASLASIAVASYSCLEAADFELLVDTIDYLAAIDSETHSVIRFLDLNTAMSLIDLFLTCFLTHGPAAAILYKIFLCVVTAADSVAVRLAAMKLLIRLRCDANRCMKVVKQPDTQELAANLCRTKATAGGNRNSASPSSQRSTASHASPSSKESVQTPLTLSRAQSRSGTRPRKARDSFRTPSQPLWMYETALKGLPRDPPDSANTSLFAQGPKSQGFEGSFLDLEQWLKIMVEILRSGSDWELYSYVLVHLPSQISNCSLFRGSVRQISELHDLLNEQLGENTFPEAPTHASVRRGDIALCLYKALAMLLAYQDSVGVRQWKRVVSTLRSGIEKWDRVGKFCMHALTVCCYEIPNIILNQLTSIIEMMQKRLTHSELVVDILGFLSGLARIPDAFDRFDFELHQKIFGVCIRCMQYSRDERAQSSSGNTLTSPSNRISGIGRNASRQSDLPNATQHQGNSQQYVSTMAYQIMIFWFLALEIDERRRHVAWITQELARKAETGGEHLELQSLVLLDMMHRTAFSNLGETYSAPEFNNSPRRLRKRTWLVGLSIITLQFLVDDDNQKITCGQFTKRQASGTTHAIYSHNTEDRPAHQVPEADIIVGTDSDPFSMYPNHMMLQLTSTISPLPAPLQPIPLPDDDDATNRMIRVFDATDTVDGHKAAVIYIGPGQRQEQEILANTSGSEPFEAFVDKLGFKVALLHAKFNTQGLDRTDGTDGAHTYAWRDRVTEIVFHLPTLMPHDSVEDATCARKKSHIGNDHVKIIYNDSGLAYDAATFASDFNGVHIVITPEASPRFDSPSTAFTEISGAGVSEHEPSATDKYGYYMVHTITLDPFPNMFPVESPKVISASSLAPFVRQLALNASVLCQIWPQELGEYTSSWLFRLQQILKLREKHAAANASANFGYPQATDAGPSPHADGATWTGAVSYGGLAEPEKLTSSLDFTRWTK